MLDHHPRILVAGCGYTGARCADFFSAEGFAVTGLVSSEASAAKLAGKPYPVIAADAADPSRVRALRDTLGRPDALVHCLSGHGGRDPAAYRVTYVETLRNLLDALVPKFIVFTGSVSVYPQNDGSNVSEESPAGGTPTGDVLLEAEKLALDAGGAVVRLGGIYGPGRCRFLQAILPGGAPAPGTGDRSINLIHRDDAASALAHVARHRLAGVYNAVDDRPDRRSALAAAVTGLPPGPAHGPATGKRVDNAKLRSTGWAPRYPSIMDAWRDDEDLRSSLGQ